MNLLAKLIIGKANPCKPLIVVDVILAEGNWTQGGGVRGGLALNNPAGPGHPVVGPDSVGGRSTSGPCAVPGGPPGSVGHDAASQFRSLMPPFVSILSFQLINSLSNVSSKTCF